MSDETKDLIERLESCSATSEDQQDRDCAEAAKALRYFQAVLDAELRNRGRILDEQEARIEELESLVEWHQGFEADLQRRIDELERERMTYRCGFIHCVQAKRVRELEGAVAHNLECVHARDGRIEDLETELRLTKSMVKFDRAYRDLAE